ncbi:hypothetical protein RhiirC2_772374 [Rhizophagus irregularis]|uniref:Uncharacterized protein n=2 Tax=Rhizophagus irregularis TaxID=588596 RepID=A0A2N1NRT1_9GLOM|nr:hypothetical protein RhiirC2_772374 [Rhizophagus irregularis]
MSFQYIYANTSFNCPPKRKFSKKLLFLINGKLSAILLIFLLSIPTVRADDDDEYANETVDDLSINLISVIFGALGSFLGRGRTMRAGIQGSFSIVLWLLPSISMLPSHNEGFEKFETENEILTSYINFLNIIRLYFFSGAGREMLTCIAIFKFRMLDFIS